MRVGDGLKKKRKSKGLNAIGVHLETAGGSHRGGKRRGGEKKLTWNMGKGGITKKRGFEGGEGRRT